MLITRNFSPPNLGDDAGADISKPVSKVSLTYTAPAGQVVSAVTLLAALVNGVDVVKNMDGASPSADLVTFPHPIFLGNMTVCIAQGVDHDISGVHSQFSTGAIFNSSADWRGRLPLSSQPYRRHGINFTTANEFLNKEMDPMWKNHEDIAAILQMLGALRQAGESESIRMMNVRNTFYIQWVEPVDRVDGVVVNITGAVSDPVPFIDIEALYHLPSNSRLFLYGYDYFLNARGQVVFTCPDAPGRVAAASVAGMGTDLERPADSLFSVPTQFSITTSPIAVFSSGEISGFDFFLRPPRLPDSAGYPAYSDGSDFVGKMMAYIPKTGESITLYDPVIGANSFSGTVKLKTPVTLGTSDYIQIYQVRPPSFPDSIGNQHDDTNPAIDVVLWLNRSVQLLGPHAHSASNRLNYLWTQIAGGDIGSRTLQDKLRAAAAMQARTDKSLQSFATYVEALLKLPLSPFDGAYVTQIFQPDDSGIVTGQINIYGAIQEFDGAPTFAVAVGDKVAFLQSLLSEADGVSVHDAATDADFMAFTSDGLPPASDSSASAYVQSKIVGAVQLPDDFLAQYPGGNQLFFAALILKSKSFRIDLGVYASQKFIADPFSTRRIFQAIDAVKPSGSDYWIRLADGTAIVRGGVASGVVNISSQLDLPTNYAQRIYTDAGFAVKQWKAFYVNVEAGAKPLSGDAYAFVMNSASTGAYTDVQTVTAGDLVASPLHPLDPLLTRWADNITAAFPTKLVAGVQNHSLRIQLILTSVNFESMLYLSPLTASAHQVSGNGFASFDPSSPTLVPPADPSTIWETAAAAIDTMNSYQELSLVTAPDSVRDFGAGPYDASISALGAGVSWDTEAPVVGTVGRIRIEGYAYSSGGETDSMVEIGLNPTPALPALPASVTLTVSGGSLVAPVALTRFIRADDVDSAGVIVGLAKSVMSDPDLGLLFKATYPPVVNPAYLRIVPLDVDAADLSTYIFTLTSTGWAPTFYVANSAGNSSGAGPLSISPAPTAPAVVTFSAAYTGFTTRVLSKTIYSPPADGGGNRFVVDFTYLPGASTTDPVTVTITHVSGRAVQIQNIRVVINNYPEYSRDSDFIILGSAVKLSSRAGTFTYDAGAGNPPITPVPTPVSIYYYEREKNTVDVTPRLVAPSKQLVSSFVEDFGTTEIYLGNSGFASRGVFQNKDPGNVAVSISYIAGSTDLYKKETDGSYTALVLGTDYTETTPGSGLVGVIGAPLQTAVVVGFVKSTLYDYYFEGPNSVSYRSATYVNSAPGVRALYDESGASPNAYRAANANNLGTAGGVPIAAPYSIADYLASGVVKNPAFGLDISTIRIVPGTPTIIKGKIR